MLLFSFSYIVRIIKQRWINLSANELKSWTFKRLQGLDEYGKGDAVQNIDLTCK